MTKELTEQRRRYSAQPLTGELASVLCFDHWEWVAFGVNLIIHSEGYHVILHCPTCDPNDLILQKPKVITYHQHRCSENSDYSIDRAEMQDL